MEVTMIFSLTELLLTLPELPLHYLSLHMDFTPPEHPVNERIVLACFFPKVQMDDPGNYGT